MRRFLVGLYVLMGLSMVVGALGCREKKVDRVERRTEIRESDPEFASPGREVVE